MHVKHKIAFEGSPASGFSLRPYVQMSNAVQDDIGVNFEALVDIFPSCQGSGPRSWEVNDLSPTLQGEEVRIALCQRGCLLLQPLRARISCA